MVCAFARLEAKTSQSEFSCRLSTQRERDAESSLLHFRARSYDPRLGSFVQMEPVRALVGTRQAYAYASSRPTRFGDPTGRITWDLTHLKRRANEGHKASQASLTFWEQGTKPGGIEQELKTVIDRMVGHIIRPSWFNTGGAGEVGWAPIPSPRSKLYDNILKQIKVTVWPRTGRQQRALMETPLDANGRDAPKKQVSVAGLEWPGTDEKAVGIKSAAFILLHEIVHVAQDLRDEPVVALKGPFALSELRKRFRGIPRHLDGVLTQPRTEPYAFYLQGRFGASLANSIRGSQIYAITRKAGLWFGVDIANPLGARTAIWKNARWRESMPRRMNLGVRGAPEELWAPPRRVLKRTEF